MDPHSHRRRHHRSDFADQRLTELARAPNKRFNINTTRLAKILATGNSRASPTSEQTKTARAPPNVASKTRLIAAGGFEEGSCLSSGLGNKVLSVTAVLLYALLTNRVMLIDRGEDTVDLFYEPFPKTSWILPLDFLITQKFNGFNMKSPQCHGKHHCLPIYIFILIMNISITISFFSVIRIKLFLKESPDERIGIQVRVFDTRPGPFKYVMDQILDCTLKQKLLPEVDNDESAIKSSAKPKLKAVLVTSLNSRYYGILRNMYWEYSTVTGDMVTVYQPSHEEYQQTEKSSHNGKALAEMYLLGITDVLITSSWSTFG
ncbi:hypothetical protein WN943_020733 [Citrus x changshan-huyou]